MVGGTLGPPQVGPLLDEILATCLEKETDELSPHCFAEIPGNCTCQDSSVPVLFLPFSVRYARLAHAHVITYPMSVTNQDSANISYRSSDSIFKRQLHDKSLLPLADLSYLGQALPYPLALSCMPNIPP